MAYAKKSTPVKIKVTITEFPSNPLHGQDLIASDIVRKRTRATEGGLGTPGERNHSIEPSGRIARTEVCRLIAVNEGLTPVTFMLLYERLF